MFRNHLLNRLLLLATLLGILPFPLANAQERDQTTDLESEIVEIAFATNRSKVDGEEGPDRFGNEAGPLRYGTCQVEFEPIGFLKDAARHISLRFPTEMEDIVAIKEMDPETFWARVKDFAGRGEKKAIFYIHGYKMDFDKACRRTALMKRELGPEVEVLLFAWPSQDNFALYTQDETLLKTSVSDIRSVLEHLLESFATGVVDAVGHSLGTRGVTAAIAGMEAREAPLFDELILVAPDMDRFDFEEARPMLSRTVSGTTIYVSENDGPLRVSQEVHGVPRIGQAGEFLTLFEGVETVDISNAPRRDIYGHNYHYFNSRITDDMRILLTEGTRAGDRPGLQMKSMHGKSYWEMSGEE